MSDMRLIEPPDVPEVFVSGLGRIEIMEGGVARYHLYVDRTAPDGTPRREVVLCVVAPLTALPAAIEQMTGAYHASPDGGTIRLHRTS